MYYKLLLWVFYHELLKYKPRCDLRSKMPWDSDFKSFTENFRYNSEELSSKFPISKMKLSRINMSFPVQVLY